MNKSQDRWLKMFIELLPQTCSEIALGHSSFNMSHISTTGNPTCPNALPIPGHPLLKFPIVYIKLSKIMTNQFEEF